MTLRFTLVLLSVCFMRTQAQEITFVSQPLPVATVVQFFDSLAMHVNVTAEESDDVLMSQENFDVRRYSIEVLEAEHLNKQSIRLDVSEAWSSGQTPGGGRINSEIHQKGYMLSRRADTVLMFRDDGSDVSPEERSAIERLGGNSDGSSLSKVLEGRSMRIGETFALGSDLLADFRGIVGNEAMELKDASLTLAGLRDVQGLRCAVFEMKLELVSDQQHLDMEASLGGEIVVAIDYIWPLSISMHGDIRGVATPQGMTLWLSGTVNAAKNATVHFSRQ
jgi:hypothetical protein